MPASHFFEFTGAKSPKTKWKFTKAGEDWFCIGLWRPMPQGGEAFTLLTTAPFADWLARSPWFDAVWIDDNPEWWDLAGWLRVRAQSGIVRSKKSAARRIFAARGAWPDF